MLSRALCSFNGTLHSFSEVLRFVSGVFWFLETKFAKLLDPHIILGVGKQQDLRNKFCETVGDALII